MYRIAIEELIKWKSSSSRKPLVIKGVRQSGKTYLLNEFGRSHYADLAYCNSEAGEISQNCIQGLARFPLPYGNQPVWLTYWRNAFSSRM